MEQSVSDLSKAEQRLAQALNRLSQGIDQVPVQTEVFSSARSRRADQDTDRDEQIAALKAALDAASAQLERSKSTIEDQAAQISDLSEKILNRDSEIARLNEAAEAAPQSAPDVHRDELRQVTAVLASVEGKASRLKAANSALRSNNKELRRALKKGLADPEAVNAGLEASLATLVAEREVETAERQALLDLLKPLLEQEASDA